MMKTQSYKKGWAFVLTLAMVFTTLFGGFGFMGINGAVGEVHAVDLISDTLDLTDPAHATTGAGWEWDNTTKVLTLSGINLSTSSPTGIKVPTGTSIVLVGDNNVESIQTSGESSYGIYAVNGLIITGSGILNATGGAVTGYNDSHGIHVDYGDCTINSGTITVSSGTLTVSGRGNNGIYSTHGIIINGGTITALSGFGGLNGHGIHSNTMVINGGVVNATGGNGAVYSVGIYSNSISVNGGTVNAYGGIGSDRSLGISWGTLYFNGGTTTATTLAVTGTRGAVGVLNSISFAPGVMITQPVGAGISNLGSPYANIIATTPGGTTAVTSATIVYVDTTPPTAGGGGTITTGTATASTVGLSWTAGTDNVTAPGNLQYKVVYSTSNNIDTLTNANANGVVAMDWTGNTTSHIVTGLTASTNYYFNTIIRDQAGNMAVYTTTSTATTASTSGSSGSGGSSTPATPVINTNTGSVTGNQLKNAAEAAKDGETVTIKSDKTSEVTFPASGLGSLTGNNNSLTVVTDNGTLTFDSKAVGSMGTQATATDIKVIVEDVVKTTLTEEQQAKVGNKTVYDLSVMSGGKLISSFNGGKVTVSIPYELKNGETAENLTVWYMADDGSLTEITCTYDAKTKSVVFVVDHFSKYIIGYDDLADWVNPFTDVKSSAWYYNAAAFVNVNGLMKGETDTTFAPQTAMTRGMFVAILGRMEGVDTTKYADKNTFSDVKSSQYYAPYIAWASDKAIVTGMGGDKFAPNAAVTREQMAVMMTNYMKYKDQGPVGLWAIQLTYGDLDKVSSWADEGVMFMTMKDLMNGMGNDAKGNPLFAPKETSTRAQTAQVMMNLEELLK